ncbi:MAG: TlyA family RNA methyltransferase [Alphaproteobacteria bacterium]
MLVARGLAPSRAKAQALIRAGQVFAGTVRLDKPGHGVGEDLDLEVRAALPYVSRGGLKLAHAIDHFGFDASGRTALDIGASTGGFSDVLLQNGARRVYAVDVGRGQLDWGLRNDPRVIVLEGVNARYLSRREVPEPIEALVCDASFIGLKTVLPAALDLVTPGGWLVALIKPQFEVGRDKVGKKGVVRDPELHRSVCTDIEAWLAARPGWAVRGVTESPVTGPEGNREFLIGAERVG